MLGRKRSTSLRQALVIAADGFVYVLKSLFSPKLGPGSLTRTTKNKSQALTPQSRVSLQHLEDFLHEPRTFFRMSGQVAHSLK